MRDSPDAVSESDDLPALPGGVQDEAGEETMDTVPAGLLGSSAVRSGPRFSETSAGDDAVEAELVSDSDEDPEATVSEATELDPDETIDVGEETLVELSGRAKTRRLGDFELERKVGQGGMGEVWLARQVSLDRPVAVKVLPRTLATQENFIERFQREAKAAASLVHPNVIQIYAYGIDEGTPYFAMEFVEGEDLQERMRRGRPEWSEIADVMMGVASALHVAHDKGLIHRDIKPSNVMVDRNGIVKVMDFGLAKATSGGPEAKSLTNAGLIMGTPNYLSPEQGRGDPLDGRSDLYSLGIVLYELLTGSLPFRADTPAGLIFKHVYEPPPPPSSIRSDIPPFLEEIALKLLEKDPEDRYANPQELLADLGEFLDHYDYYVAEAGERRPGSGFYDPERLKRSLPGGNVSGAIATRGKRTPSEKRHAVTEELTGGVPRPEPRRVEPERERPRPAPPPPPPPRSKAPLVVAALLLVAGSAFGYAYAYEREWLIGMGRDLGLVAVPPTGTGGQGTGTAGTGTSGTGTGTSGTGTTGTGTTGTGTGERPDVGELTDGYVAFVFTGSWPEATTIRLRGAKSTHQLERQTTGKFPPGEYRLEFERPGYEPIAWTVRLSGEPGELGRLTDAKGVDAATAPLAWAPTRELSGAYAEGQEALAAKELERAAAALERAARLDPEFRPAPDQRSVRELQDEVARGLDALRQAADHKTQLVELAREHMAQRRWRTALDTLLTLPEPERDTGWRDLAERCRAAIKTGDTLAEAVDGAVRRGEHALAQSKLAELEAEDPEHRSRAALEARLRDATALRERALAQGADEPLAAAKARLEQYLSQFGPEDAEARQALADVEKRLVEEAALNRALAELDTLAAEGDWVRVRRIAVDLLQRHPTQRQAQELRRRAETELAREAVLGVVTELDRGLVSGQTEVLLPLLDRESPTFEKERSALLGLREVEAVFTSSEHRHAQVEVEGNFARVQAEWRFDLRVLGEPVLSYEADHVLRLRLEGKSWLLTELRVEGDVRVRPR